MKKYKGDILVSIDGAKNIILDREIDLLVGLNYIINGTLVTVNCIQNSTVYVRSI